MPPPRFGPRTIYAWEAIEFVAGCLFYPLFSPSFGVIYSYEHVLTWPSSWLTCWKANRAQVNRQVLQNLTSNCMERQFFSRRNRQLE